MSYSISNAKTVMSRAIETYFGLPDARPPSCFVLNSIDNLPCGYTATFRDTPDPSDDYVGVVTWRSGGVDVQLYGESRVTKGTPFNPSASVYDESHMKLLKSNLQKTVRRGNVQAAISTANEMLNINPIQLVQRLAIIWIEDCVLTQEFAILPWCLAAMSKGWLLTENLAIVVITLAGRLAHMPVRDVHGTKRERFQVSKIAGVSDPNCRSLLYSLQFRRDYQCMSSDKAMIDQCLADWTQRLKTGLTVMLVLPDLPANIALDLRMDKKHWSIASVDQHCSALCTWVAEDLRISKKLVERVVWENSSRYTTKKVWEKGRKGAETGDASKELWHSIKEHVWTKARSVIDLLPHRSSEHSRATEAAE